MRELIISSRVDTRALYRVIYNQSRAFPHTYDTFLIKIQNPGKMARHLHDHPELYDLIKSLIKTEPSQEGGEP